MSQVPGESRNRKLEIHMDGNRVNQEVRLRNGEKAQILPVPIVTSFRGHYISDRAASRQLKFLAKGREACSAVRRPLR